MDFYSEISQRVSKLFTRAYSTSFSSGISTLDSSLHEPIYSIYGFVRLADEIVDTFYDQNQRELLEKFTQETYRSIEDKFSLNPILQSFQLVVNQYNIPHEYIKAFLYSMELDLEKRDYSEKEYKEYIYGSAEVVGLMCLKVFCGKNDPLFESLIEPAKALGSAFQKINFLRDIKSDFEERGRVYFPHIDFNTFTDQQKKEIEADIQKDFDFGWEGIQKLPINAKKGVKLAYHYYQELTKIIQNFSAERIKNERIRVPDSQKLILYLRVQLNLI